MIWLAAHWSLFMWSALASVAYLAWKSKGGRLLFREQRKDDETTKMMKGIAALFFGLGAMIVAVWVAAISVVLLVVSLICLFFV